MAFLKKYKIYVLIYMLALSTITFIYNFKRNENDPVRKPIEKCVVKSHNELSCEKAYFDDGLSIIRVFEHKDNNCCIVEKFNVREKKIHFNVLVCLPKFEEKASCDKIKGKYSIESDFFIDGKNLMIMKRWSDHVNIFEEVNND